MKYHIEITSHYPLVSQKDCAVITIDGGLREVIKQAWDMVLTLIDRGAEDISDIWIVRDEDWCANRWNAGAHFTVDSLRMRYRMYRNEVQE